MRITITVEEGGQIRMSSLEAEREGLTETGSQASDEPLDGGPTRVTDDPQGFAEEGAGAMGEGSSEDAGAAPAFDLNGKGDPDVS